MIVNIKSFMGCDRSSIIRAQRTRRHRGGGHKRRYRVIDMGRAVRGTQGTVQRIEYDPNRTARIALVKYDSLAEQGEQTGQRDFADGLRWAAGCGAVIRRRAWVCRAERKSRRPRSWVAGTSSLPRTWLRGSRWRRGRTPP